MNMNVDSREGGVRRDRFTILVDGDTLLGAEVPEVLVNGMVGAGSFFSVGLALSCDNGEVVGAIVSAMGEMVVAGDGVSLVLVPIIGATLENETDNAGSAL
jgi:hypothetical protein